MPSSVVFFSLLREWKLLTAKVGFSVESASLFLETESIRAGPTTWKQKSVSGECPQEACELEAGILSRGAHRPLEEHDGRCFSNIFFFFVGSVQGNFQDTAVSSHNIFRSEKRGG